MIQFCNSEVKLVVFCSVVMSVNELLDNVDWDKYFDVEVSKELFELEDVDLGENWDEIGELCGTGSLCCVPQAHKTEPIAREETSHDAQWLQQLHLHLAFWSEWWMTIS